MSVKKKMKKQSNRNLYVMYLREVGKLEINVSEEKIKGNLYGKCILEPEGEEIGG